MERSAFSLLERGERSWWYRGRAKVVQSVLRRLPHKGLSILDFGAGFGGMFQALSHWGSVVACEPDGEAQTRLRERGYAEVHASDQDALAKSYDLIALFDVLEHIQDDATFLRNAYRALRGGGHIVMTVPAMPFLWSRHDVSHHHYRRYTRASLNRILVENGYRIDYIGYWNMFLFPAATIARMLGRGGESSFALPSYIDAFLSWLVEFEAYLMRYIRLPFGVSLIVLAHKD